MWIEDAKCLSVAHACVCVCVCVSFREQPTDLKYYSDFMFGTQDQCRSRRRRCC